ncbi:hypothetical protein FALBO_9001 [Fusarium albosuccineum]|uniref:Uncharacterized protein n=1 Tax=Fusarium albosuccineum TaxID=1237068 RepID=A0A8H4LA72_9HYPO|nr:hypothetical protein FALBO_9001 [Fusarium albosuccineum]
MATYEVKVTIPKKWVETFNENGTKLCFSHGVKDSGSGLNFNVVGTAVVAAENVKLTWTDVYWIAGGRQSFSAGTKIDATTNPEKIKFHQMVKLDKAFVLEPPVQDDKVEDGQFSFNNEPIASAYLYKSVAQEDGGKEETLPFYISQGGPNPPGRSIFTPKPVTRIYFAKHVETGTMIEDYQTVPIDIDLTGKTKAEVAYDADGNWKEKEA